jgi:C-terminal processing protease CtpA/Prc
MIKVRHFKVSTVPDAGNSTLVQPSDWNADHYVDDVTIAEVVGLQAALDGKVNVGDVITGIDGKSAYEIALEEGFVGTQTEWLESLVGAAGKSAYQVALDEGFVGTQAEWLETLKGFTVEPVDANKILTNDGNTAYWVGVTHTLEGFVEAVEESLKTITVDQGDIV